TVAPADVLAPTAAAPTAAPVAPATAAYPVTIENCGRTLTFTQAPERVLAVYQPLAEIMIALGLGEKIVGIQYGQSQDPLPEQAEAFTQLNWLAAPGTGSASKELLIDTRPDLVLASYYAYDLDPSSGAASEDDYQAIGAQVYGMATGEPCLAPDQAFSFAALYGDIRMLGVIFGIPDRAEALVEQMQGRIAAVQQRVAGRTPVSAIYYEDGQGPLTIYGAGLATEQIALAGGINLLAEQPSYAQVGQEVIAASGAEVWVLAECPSLPPVSERATYLFRTFTELPASQNQRSVGVNCAASGVGLRLPEAVEVMARAFHPDAFDAASTVETATYPVTIENCGNMLTFTQAPERIAPLYPPVTEMLLLLGLDDRIVGIGGSGTEPVLPELQAAYQALPRLADSSAIPREVLLAAEPELVLDNQPDYFYDASQGFATREEIATAGAQIYTLSAKCDGGKLDATMEDVYTDLRNLGAIFGVSAQAEAEIAAMQARIAAVTAQLDEVEPVSVIYYDAGEGPLGIFGPGTWEYVFTLAGATNAFSDLSESYVQISIEEVATRDADVIVVAGYEGGEKTSEERAAFIRSTFPNSTAVQNDRVIIIPYEYTNPGIQNVLGVEFLARALHPERFAE
ncbi:ABC transporter substrate-binding protein, partial [Candidatus Gracilibacteria bacterium]|nr:ABC transporter substrate-binding protein [Candidatus Gracilibacteria bacterium]